MSPCLLHLMCEATQLFTEVGYYVLPSLYPEVIRALSAATSAPKLGSLLLVLTGHLWGHACAQCHNSLNLSSPGVFQGTHEVSRPSFARYCSIWTRQDCPGDPWVLPWKWEKINVWKEKIFSLTYSKASLDAGMIFSNLLFYLLALLGPESGLQTRRRLICPGQPFHRPLVLAQ